MKSKKAYSKSIFIFLLLALVIGFIGGSFFAGHKSGRKLFFSSGNKIDVILDIIDSDYVDSVDMKEMVENAIPKLVSELDPHSKYLPAEELTIENEDMEGHFSGIGVRFMKLNDTIIIYEVMSGGPSEKAGLQAGDRIVAVEDSSFVGDQISEEKIQTVLRGPKDTKVKIEIKRPSFSENISYDIIRGDVPVNTIDVAYQINKDIGLIRINKFGRTTYDEFVTSLAKLLDSGCSSLILDLRGNMGGLLDAAINITNEFLSSGQLIVSIQGKAFPKEEIVANGTGTCQEIPLVILMNEASASSSEVIAGAIQDNDRGLIIGKPSYGKGLVQNQIQLSDNSALRLTTARYYTPSGRCIQRKYELGRAEEYDQAFINRLLHEEIPEDNIEKEGLRKFYTRAGRPVYEGGGIIPDIYVSRDTSGYSSYFFSLENKDIFQEYTFKYADEHREKLSKFKDYQTLWGYLKLQPLLENIISYADSKGIRRRPVLINISSKLIEKTTHAYIIRNFFGDAGFFSVYLNDDPMVLKAVEVIDKKETFPGRNI